MPGRARTPGAGHPAVLVQAAHARRQSLRALSARRGCRARRRGAARARPGVDLHRRQFDANGLLSGRFVREGEVIGKVANYFKRERGTTYHLHFDVQVPTKYGWVFVNPYMSLVAAYERL